MSTDNPENEEYRCSECNATVKFDGKVCPICGADLSEIIEKDTDDVVLLKIFQNEFDAQTAKAQLEETGVVCILSGDNECGWAPSLPLTNGIRILVSENEIEKAIEVLKAMEMY